MNKNILSESWISDFKKDLDEIFWKNCLIETLENLNKSNGDQASFFSLKLHKKSVSFSGREKGKMPIFEQYTEKELLEKIAGIRTIVESLGDVEFDVSICPSGVYHGLDATQSKRKVEITKHIPKMLVGQTKVSQALYYAVMGTNPIKKVLSNRNEKIVEKVLQKSWKDYVHNWAHNNKYMWSANPILFRKLQDLYPRRSSVGLAGYTDQEIEIAANHVKLDEIKLELLFNMDRKECEIADVYTYVANAYYIDQDGNIVFSGNDFELINGSIPISCLRFDDVAEFCNRLSALLGLDPCYEKSLMQPNEDRSYKYLPNRNGYRLPSTLEFEYLAQAGTQNAWSGTNDPKKLDQYVITLGGKFDKARKLYPKQRKPNEWELYDMNGLFFEISNDKSDDLGFGLLNGCALGTDADSMKNTYHRNHRTDLNNLELLTSFRIVRNLSREA